MFELRNLGMCWGPGCYLGLWLSVDTWGVCVMTETVCVKTKINL